MTLEEKGKRIIQDIKEETSTNPVRIFKNMAKKDYIAIHGPEHHVLDGASKEKPKSSGSSSSNS